MLRAGVDFINKYVLIPAGVRLVSNRPKPAITEYMARRFLLLADVFAEISNVEGCVVECGVGFGRGLVNFSYLLQHQDKERTIYGFDTFAGYPVVTDRDYPQNSAVIPAKVGGLAVSRQVVLDFIRDSGIKDSYVAKNIRLVEGDVVNTTKAFDGGPIALLVTELDMYEGRKAALENLLPHVAPGGVVLPLNYYDRGLMKFPGSYQAVEEVFGTRIKDFKTNVFADRKYYIKPA